MKGIESFIYYSNVMLYKMERAEISAFFFHLLLTFMYVHIIL